MTQNTHEEGHHQGDHMTGMITTTGLGRTTGGHCPENRWVGQGKDQCLMVDHQELVLWIDMDQMEDHFNSIFQPSNGIFLTIYIREWMVDVYAGG